MPRWTFDDIPDLTGRTAVVTGANTGIGYETARMLAARGADVVLACRDGNKGREALARLRDGSPGARASLEILDLADLDEVAATAASLMGALDRLDLLILNAGVMVPPESLTAQGFELQFGVNHLGHFALTGRLLPLLRATGASRVVAVSSTAARRGAMDFEDLDFTRRGYRAWSAYCQSKLANQLFARELQRRLDTAGASVLATAAHPGWTATDLQRTSPLLRALNRFFAQDARRGALPTLRAAVDPDARGADYFGPDGFLQMRGLPVRVSMVPRAMDEGDARRLWEVSEERTGVTYDL